MIQCRVVRLVRLACLACFVSSAAFPPWPPLNPCRDLGEACHGSCEMNCQSAGFKFPPETCWPVHGDGWSCDYYGGRYFCPELHTTWSCQSGFGLVSGKGCHCWSGYRGYSKCCPCPEVENCAGREYISCSSTKRAWGTGNLTHLHASRCSLCKPGYAKSSDNTSCLR
ncbi:unnamed protein product [Cladocopium goreaui]|uniref:Uncharacterized protein n=1 Tax=Cladocopium goreaui TaxID=2562237 RepID=A0A9P1FGQ9_9DINO|nr:unnamed protein product [Cladocopium goreaui]